MTYQSNEQGNNSSTLKICHYNSPILKFTITIILLPDTCHFLRLPGVWAHCQAVYLYTFSAWTKTPSAASLPPLTDVWAPHVRFSFNLQPSWKDGVRRDGRGGRTLRARPPAWELCPGHGRKRAPGRPLPDAGSHGLRLLLANPPPAIAARCLPCLRERALLTRPCAVVGCLPCSRKRAGEQQQPPSPPRSSGTSLAPSAHAGPRHSPTQPPPRGTAGTGRARPPPPPPRATPGTRRTRTTPPPCRAAEPQEQLEQHPCATMVARRQATAAAAATRARGRAAAAATPALPLVVRWRKRRLKE